jgi:hypothetical protein
VDHQTFAELLGNYGEFIGSIAVLLTLIYVAIQVRHGKNLLEENRQFALSEVRQTVLNGAQTELRAMMDYPEVISSLVSAETPTAEQQIRINAFLFVIWRLRLFAWIQWQQGIIDEQQWDAELKVVLFFLDSDRVVQWWDKAGRNSSTEIWEKFIDELIAENPATNSFLKITPNWADIQTDAAE